MITFKGKLSDKQSFALNGVEYRSDADGCFHTDNEEFISFLRKSPFWEEIVNVEVNLLDIPKFGDYITVEQQRYGVPNQYYTYKVVGTLKSNSYTPVPVVSNGERIIDKDSYLIVRAIQCGVSEETVERFRIQDVKIKEMTDKQCFNTTETDSIDSEKENKQLKKELLTYQKIFSIKEKGLTLEEEEFWSDVNKLQFRVNYSNVEILAVIVSKCDFKNKGILIICNNKNTNEIFINAYYKNGYYFSDKTLCELDIIKKDNNE